MLHHNGCLATDLVSRPGFASIERLRTIALQWGDLFAIAELIAKLAGDRLQLFERLILQRRSIAYRQP